MVRLRASTWSAGSFNCWMVWSIRVCGLSVVQLVSCWMVLEVGCSLVFIGSGVCSEDAACSFGLEEVGERGDDLVCVASCGGVLA